jgi:pyrroloquinoline quinone biosynthesis protein A
MLDMWYNICLVQIRTTFLKDITMWTKPTATEMRFGFEVTMYVMNK